MVNTDRHGKKANGGYRLCLDFRKLNVVSKKDVYPMPHMSYILKQLKASKYISTIDSRSAFNQIPLDKACQEYTVFTVPGRGLFQFMRMPFGLPNALDTFQRLIDRVIGPELGPPAFCYLDNIIVVTETFEEHFKWLEAVLDKITQANLTVNPEKCNPQVSGVP